VLFHVILSLLWLVLSLFLHCFASWSFIGGRRLLITYSFNKNFYVLSMFDFLKSCVTFVHSFFFFLILKKCVDNMFGFVCAKTTCNLEKLLTTLNFCFVILKKFFRQFHIMFFVKNESYLIICKCLCLFSHFAKCEKCNYSIFSILVY
jgi:hypothetical protein